MKPDLSISADKLRLLKNFLHEYSFTDCDRLIGLIYNNLEVSLEDASESDRDQILSFVESLEEVIQALHGSNLIPFRNEN